MAIVCGIELLAQSAQAGAPFQTDDPEPTEYLHHELYVASEQTKTADGSSGSRPLVELNYGAAPDLQLSIGVPFEFDDARHGPYRRGLGDIELGAKYRIVQESDSSPMVSIFPIVDLPTGDSDQGLGNGASQFFLPIWFQKKWGNWQSYGGGGYWINRAAGAKNHWFFGWQVQRRLSARWTLGGEIYHETEEVAGEGSSAGFNLGGSYDLDARNHLLFSAGRGLTNISAMNQLSSYVGYLLTW
ncbi:MAG TPA: transporter [Spongiibacteraceae bacterium]